MATYGIDFYGGATYGNKSFLEFTVSPFYGTPASYGSVSLTWETPSGNWSRMRLVRGGYGYPVTEDDGAILFDIPSGPATPDAQRVEGEESWVDTDLPEGSFFYYAIFVLAEPEEEDGTAEWRLAGTSLQLTPKNYDYTSRMMARIPSVMSTTLLEAGGQGDQGTTLFYRFLSVFGFDLDFIRTQYDSLLNLYDPDKVSGNLLPVLAETLGVEYEPEIGVRQTRILLRNIVTIRKRKGSLLAAEALASAFTGWGAKARLGANLQLDYDDSSFVRSLGRWQADVNCTIERRASDDVIFAYSAPDFVNIVGHMLQVNCTGGTAVVRQMEGRDPVLTGIPVEPGLPYAASIFARADTVVRNVRVGVEWFDHRGVYLGQKIDAGVTNELNDWDARPQTLAVAPSRLTTPTGLTAVAATTGGTLAAGAKSYAVTAVNSLGQQTVPTTATATTTGSTGSVTLTWDAVPLAVSYKVYGRSGATLGLLSTRTTTSYTDTGSAAPGDAPPTTNDTKDAYYAGLELRVTSAAAGEIHYFDAAQLEQNTAVTAWQEARDIRIELDPDRTNEARNPSAEIDTVGWTATGAALTRATNRAFSGEQTQLAPAKGQTASFLLTQSSTAAPYMTSEDHPVLPLTPYTFSAYSVGGTTGGVVTGFRADLQWFDDTDTLLGTSVGPVQAMNANTQWWRTYLTSISPETASYCRMVLTGLGGSTGSTFHFDGVLLEHETRLLPYFDASWNPLRLADYLWEGGDDGRHHSRSHYYFNRTIKNLRLKQLLRQHLSFHTTASLLYAQPTLT